MPNVLLAFKIRGVLWANVLDLGTREMWVQTPALPLVRLVMLDELFNPTKF